MGYLLIRVFYVRDMFINLRLPIRISPRYQSLKLQTLSQEEAARDGARVMQNRFPCLPIPMISGHFPRPWLQLRWPWSVGKGSVAHSLAGVLSPVSIRKPRASVNLSSTDAGSGHRAIGRPSAEMRCEAIVCCCCFLLLHYCVKMFKANTLAPLWWPLQLFMCGEW